MRLEKQRIELKVIPLHPVPVSSFNVDDRTGTPGCRPTQVAQVLKSRSGCKNSGKIWWMMKFLNAETHTPVLLIEAFLEPTSKRREDLGKHSVYTHFPKDRNCEICERTKIIRAPCRRHNGGAVPRAENFGCESRNNHRYAVVVQDSSTPHRSETNGIAGRAVRRVKEGTSAVLLQSSLDQNCWADFHGMLHLSSKHSRSLV